MKNDKFKKSRGGYSRLLDISCIQCGALVARYQKDGSGPLKRMYLDRILSPNYLVGLNALPLKKLSPLTCKKCRQIIGIPFLYQKEKRPSFRLFEGATCKKIIKL